MANIRQIITDWGTVNGGGKVSVMYFDSSVNVADQRTALETMFDALLSGLDNTTNYVIRGTGVEVSDSTGSLVDLWSETSTKSGTGTGTGEPVADAVQALLRFKTQTLRAGRFIQGRCFIPGVSTSQQDGGNLTGAAVSAFGAAANTLASGSAGLMVWSRPRGAIPGVAANATAGTCWNEFAVLRRRRN